MQKIVVIGSPGAGKSTFARRLGALLAIDVYHLDRFFWESGWHEKARSSRIDIQRSLIEKRRWIIEGTYFGTSDDRLNAADTVIFLDVPCSLCLWRVIKRRFMYSDKPRPDLPEGCKEKLRLLYTLKVLAFPLRGRRLFFRKIREIEESQVYEKKTAFFWLRSNRDIEIFLLEQGRQGTVSDPSINNQQSGPYSKVA